MSSKCEKNFPVCSDNIDVDVTNFPANTDEKCKKDYHKEEDKKCDYYVKAKVLRKVAEAKITQPITDSIFIPESFFSIKRISRRVVLTQCFVVPEKKERDYYKHDYYDHDECNAHLFVEGFILKNVEYATPSADQDPADPCEDCLAMRNDYNDLTAKVKFNFSVPIKLEDADLAENIKNKETAILKDCMKPCDKGSLSESDCERIHYQSVELQEPFTCELDKYQISEAVISKTACNTTDPDLFDTVVEKLTLKLNISIFQLQTKKIEVHHDK
ncbi:hypothetical protein UT300003_23830 [Clostridium sardiniense]|uniref:DUF7852 domain-containing protein n=1 Tax=Clostridium sardiniense TaxID=29369 RepID=UPI001957A315|nr:hypothetical protein [Clostridium sardiniense]MBM7834472.1 hypothetical protein [Clostridium sardiniense]